MHNQDCENFELAPIIMVRVTRNHPDIEPGASIRAAIDLVDLFRGMQKPADQIIEETRSRKNDTNQDRQL